VGRSAPKASDVIYREMPPIWDRAFRQRFYERWGRENAVVAATTRRAQYPPYTQLLSIKMMSHGCEDYFIDGRRICVDDDTFLILNEGRCYGSSIDAIVPGRSFSVFFRPGMAREVQDCMTRSCGSLLDDPDTRRMGNVEFEEQLLEHDTTVTPVLRHLQRVIEDGGGSEEWLEEELQFLLARMLRLRQLRLARQELLAASRPSTRRELARRLSLAVNFIHTHFRSRIGLADIAAAAHLSPFHLLRQFRALHGMTPTVYLSRKRTGAAIRLLRETSWTSTEIAEHVGFGCRTTLFRQLRAVGHFDRLRRSGGGSD